MLKWAREVLAVDRYDNPKRSGGCLNHLTGNYAVDNLRIFLHNDFIAKVFIINNLFSVLIYPSKDLNKNIPGPCKLSQHY